MRTDKVHRVFATFRGEREKNANFSSSWFTVSQLCAVGLFRKSDSG